MDVFLDSCGRRPYLLLIHLFVLKAAATCSKPEGGVNTVLTNEALLMNDFPEGSVASVECANGYVAESGTGIIKCTAAQWTEPDLICKKQDCGPPKPQPNMSFNLSAGTLFGAIIRVICDKGYRIKGSSYKQCYSQGWSGRAKCEIVTCKKPAEVTNGRSLWDSQDDPKYGETIQFVCDEGYTLSGTDSIICSETGVYDSQPPECKASQPQINSAGVSFVDVTTEGPIMIHIATPAPPPQVSTSTDLTASSTTHRGKTVATASVPPSTQQGGRGIFTADNRPATISIISTAPSYQDMHGGTADSGYVPLIISVVSVSSVVIILMVCLYKFLLRRKGSYDTREDLKPELLQFQNL